jgi:hypothetical protein
MEDIKTQPIETSADPISESTYIINTATKQQTSSQRSAIRRSNPSRQPRHGPRRQLQFGPALADGYGPGSATPMQGLSQGRECRTSASSRGNPDSYSPGDKKIAKPIAAVRPEIEREIAESERLGSGTVRLTIATLCISILRPFLRWSYVGNVSSAHSRILGPLFV